MTSARSPQVGQQVIGTRPITGRHFVQSPNKIRPPIFAAVSLNRPRGHGQMTILPYIAHYTKGHWVCVCVYISNFFRAERPVSCSLDIYFFELGIPRVNDRPHLQHQSTADCSSCNRRRLLACGLMAGWPTAKVIVSAFVFSLVIRIDSADGRSCAIGQRASPQEKSSNAFERCQ